MGKGTRSMVLVALIVILAGVIYWQYSGPEDVPPLPVAEGPPFGGPADIEYAGQIWAALGTLNMVGDGATVADVYPGGAPHGELLETITTTTTIDGHDGTLIVKKNFAAPADGDGITPEDVAADPNAYLVAVTIMFQREDGYDADNANWFWAKYLPDGSLDRNPADMQLAGRVGNREADAGCLGCHDDAPGEDYIFTN